MARRSKQQIKEDKANTEHITRVLTLDDLFI